MSGYYFKAALSMICLVLLIVNTLNADDDNAIELKAFADFLHHTNNNMNVKHAIVALDRTHITKHYIIELAKLIEKFHLRIFNINLKFSNRENTFMEMFQSGAHRMGIFVPQMNNVAAEENIFNIASNNGLFNNTYVWYVVVNETKYFNANTERMFGQYNIHVNADITIAIKCKNNTLLLYDLYKLCRLCSDTVQLELKGNWSATNGLQILPKFQQSYVKQRMNLQKTVVQVGTSLLNKPANVSDMEHLLNWESNMQFDLMQRKAFRLFKDVAAMYNMTLNVSFASTFGGFSLAVERKWTGIFGQVANQEVDFCAVPLRATQERSATFKYTPEYHVEDINALLRHPRRNNKRNIFFAPLTAAVWWCTLALIILTILLLTIHVHYEYKLQQHLQQQQQQQQPDKNNAIMQSGKSTNSLHSTQPHTLSDQQQHNNIMLLESRFDFIVLVIMEAILMQGPEPSIFNLLSTRILIVSTCIFSILLMQFYGAFIVGSLLAKAPRTITTPQALLDSNFDVGMENVSYNFDIFNKSLDPIAHRIFSERICRKKNLLSLDEGVARIGSGHFAFQTGVQPLYRLLMHTLTEQDYCDLQEIFINRPFVIGSILLKNASYDEFLAQGILKYRTTGLMQYNDILWKVHQPDCSLIKKNEVEVDLEHFIPALGLIAIAMAVSFGVFLLELMHHQLSTCKHMLKQQQQKKSELVHMKMKDLAHNFNLKDQNKALNKFSHVN